MSDNYPADTEQVRSYGMRGVISTGAGLGFMVFNSLLHVPVVGWIIGGALIVAGVIGFLGKSGTDRTTGGILMGAGVLGLASFLLKGLTGFVLGFGGLALVGFGVFNLFKFVKGIKSRA